MAKPAEQGPWERFQDLETQRATWEADLTTQQEALRRGSIDQITGDPVKDIVIALHGVEGVIQTKMLKAWQGLANRFEDSEEEPFLVVERHVGTRHQGYNLRPVYWVGIVPEDPLVYEGGDDVTLRSNGDFTIATMFSSGRKRGGYEPRRTDRSPELSVRERFAGSPPYGLVDRVLTELDKPIKSQHEAVTSDFKPYDEALARWFSDKSRYHHPNEYPVKNPVKKMSLLEIVVGEREVRKWARNTAVGDEKEVVTEALKHRLKQRQTAKAA